MSHSTDPSKVDAWLVAVLATAIGFTLLQGVRLRSVSPGGGVLLARQGDVGLE